MSAVAGRPGLRPGQGSLRASAKGPDAAARGPRLPDLVELTKPVTWFPPAWAFGCGLVSAGGTHFAAATAGLILAGPLACGASQALNDWFDREVDAINEPGRPIPSGRVPGRLGLWVALALASMALAVAFGLGRVVGAATALGLAVAWAYSAPPLRLKRNGWFSALACGLSYEGLPWFAGAALCLHRVPATPVLIVALLYSLGAHGIMTLNDFKSVRGDRATGLRSLPAQLGTRRACLVACVVMAAAQILVVVFLARFAPVHAGLVGLLLVVQLVLMRRLLADPAARAPWYNGTGTTLYVLGMLVAALALGAAR